MGDVRHEPERDRYVLVEDGQVAELVYAQHDGELQLLHTGVPVGLRNRGIAGQLVAAAMDRAAAEGLRVVPVCPYVRSWLEAHPEVADTLTIRW